MWISLHKGLILDHFFHLMWVGILPDLVLEELIEPSGKEIESRGVMRTILTGLELQEVTRLATLYLDTSLEDLSALVLTKRENAILLTDDRSLREAATEEGIETHGTLWIVDRLVENHFLSKAQAAEALQHMVDHGRRLPVGEVQSRLQKWK
ncbi:MAG: DUF3368 domain-containing protein [Fimbriimonadia bacterium]|nr:DUF3368 domain-containing protein [Fimbriimonadia bacterium]